MPPVDGIRSAESDSAARRRERNSWTADLLDLEAGRIGFPVLDREAIRALLARRRAGSRSWARRRARSARRTASSLDLQALGYDVVPVNPTADEVAGLRCYPTLAGGGRRDRAGRHRRRVPAPAGVPGACPRGGRGRREGPLAPARHREPRGRPDRPRRRARHRDEPVPRGRGGAGVIEAAFRGDAAAARRLAELAERAGPAVVADVEPAGRGAHGRPARRQHDPGRSRRGARGAARAGLDDGAGAPRAPRRAARWPVRRSRGSASRRSGSRRRATSCSGRTWSSRAPSSARRSTPRASSPLRARRRGRRLATLAVREAHPCAHCRQTLAEAADADALAIVDLLGNELSLDDLYPWAFRPAALGVDGDSPGATPWAGLALSLERGAAPRTGDPAGGRRSSSLPRARARTRRTRARRAPWSSALRDGRLLARGLRRERRLQPVDHGAAGRARRGRRGARGRRRTSATAGSAEPRAAPSIPSPGFRALLRAVAPAAARDRRRLAPRRARRTGRSMVDRSSWWRSLPPSAAANLAAVWVPVGLPGFSGEQKAARQHALDERFGADGWRLAHVVRGRVVPPSEAILEYEAVVPPRSCAIAGRSSRSSPSSAATSTTGASRTSSTTTTTSPTRPRTTTRTSRCGG